MIDAMHQDEKQLSVLRPTQEPKATEHIDSMLAMIQRLIEKNYAYVSSNGDVYYRVNRFQGYGKLSGRKIEDLLVGARIEKQEIKEDPLDFALWKSAKPNEPSWNSPWGDGRPGWHIECSAMSTCCLGNTFDIHGGGPDLIFPHHENEIAQSEAATGEQYANTWMHVGAVRVDGEKMSKSLGNFFTIRQILEQYSPEVVRYVLLSSHYRSSINYSEDTLKEAMRALERLYRALDGLPQVEAKGGDLFVRQFTQAMNDDFNTPSACAVLFDVVREINRLRLTDIPAAAQLAAHLRVDDKEAVEIEQLIADRLVARTKKDWNESDRIRQQLSDMNVLIEDNQTGTTWHYKKNN
ncbi:UNVERIFIED_CONTAM: hypothetical protein GTU68_040917 [Idotea baltica]|nr:hypothetical protein [Idotea baltica]